MHVVTLVFAVSTIPLLACAMVWLMGGTPPEMAQSAVLAWLIVHALYAIQLVLGSLHQLRREARGQDGSHEPPASVSDLVTRPLVECDNGQRD